jgi:hypothetical protein
MENRKTILNRKRNCITVQNGDMMVKKEKKYYMLFAKMGGHLKFALLSEDPLTFVYSTNGENGLRFTGKEYNHYESLRAKLRKLDIESNIVEFLETTKAEFLKSLQKQEEKKIKKMKDLNYDPKDIEEYKVESAKFLQEQLEKLNEN